MRQRLLIADGIVIAIALGGCGGGEQQHSSQSGSQPSEASTGSSAPSLASLPSRVLTGGELRGFTPQGQAQIVLNPAGWVTETGRAERRLETRRLEHLAFIAGSRQALVPMGGGPARGLSTAELFRSPAGARAALVGRVFGSPGRLTQFAVPGIPGTTTGFETSQPVQSTMSVGFVEGPYLYIIGVHWPTGSAPATTRAAMIEAAQRLYSRVHS
jgi:hypothetical protein